MLVALTRTFRNLTEFSLLKFVLLVFLLTISLSLMCVGTIATWVHQLSEWAVNRWIIDIGWVSFANFVGWLISFAAAFASLFIVFPAMNALIVGLFAESLATRVEAIDYPENRGMYQGKWYEGLKAGAKLAVMAIVLNILFLPFIFITGGISFFLYPLLNAYLLGREFFEMVALRHMPLLQVRQLYQANKLKIWGVGFISVIFLLVPPFSFVAPFLSAAFMVHFFQGLRKPQNAA